MAEIPDLSTFFKPGGRVEGNAGRMIQTLAADECVLKLEGDVVQCLRTDNVHAKHGAKHLVGLTRAQLLMMLKGAEASGKAKELFS